MGRAADDRGKAAPGEADDEARSRELQRRDLRRGEFAVLLLGVLEDEEGDAVRDRLNFVADAEARRLAAARAGRVGGGLAHRPCAAFPAAPPARRPKTAPAMRPVPPG